MTANELIERVDRLRPNQIDEEDKLTWLAQLEELIWREIVRTHAGAETETFDAPRGDRELLAPAAYEEMYYHWMEMKIAYANDEIDRYNNAAQAFGGAFGDFRNWYNREHMPTCRNKWLRFL